jgi:hypothetical protein
VPGLSLLIQKIQLSNLLPLGDYNSNKFIEADLGARKFVKLCKWHLRGSMIQILICVISKEVFEKPVFLLLGAIATFELVFTLWQASREITIRKFHQDGYYTSSSRFRPLSIF